MDLFSLKDHPNTLSPLEQDNFLVVLHNLGSVRHTNMHYTDATQSGFAVLSYMVEGLRQCGCYV